MSFDFSFFSSQVLQDYLLRGLLFSLQLTVVATLGGIVLGTLLALMRLSGNRLLALPAAVYVNTMRSVPLVMVLLWFFLLVPFILGRSTGAELSAVVTFIAFEAAFFCEIMRAGIQSLPRAQIQARYLAEPALHHFAASVSPYDASIAHAGHHSFSGHFARLCDWRL
jgi:glutamate/aspartate transport system permease protein